MEYEQTWVMELRGGRIAWARVYSDYAKAEATFERAISSGSAT